MSRGGRATGNSKRLLTRRGFSQSLAGATVTLAASGWGVPAAQTTARKARTDDISGLSIAEASSLLESGSLKSTDLTRACLDRIELYNPKLDAFITVLGKQALAQAAQLDVERQAGRVRSPLHGIPIALKDNIDTAGIRTTAGSQVYDDRVPTEDAEVTRRLSAAGAVLIGKTNLDEFAGGISYFGSVRNPWALDRDPMGSSSGSAAAVAAALTYGSLGTDTGGSIRLPSACCGVVGLKPTYGLVPIRGIVPMVMSFDHCGPITRTVEDAAMLLTQLAGYDQLDISSVDHPREDYFAAMRRPVSDLRIGIPRAPFYDHLDAETAKAIERALTVISRLTASTRDVQLPSTAAYTWMDLNSIGYEMYAYHEDLFKTEETRYMLMFRYFLKAYRDELNGSTESCSSKLSAYIRHRWDLELLRRTVDSAFKDFDFVVLPTVRAVPDKLSEVIRVSEHPEPTNPDKTNLDNTTPFNVFGIPAISVPCGFSSDGLPIGMMIAGPHFSEARLLSLARAYELEERWNLRRPKLNPNTPVPPIR
jgi:aspartyl-tRNA(Asn)/glutamyl-tRNA(Gln) amidotransferase subunit A